MYGEVTKTKNWKVALKIDFIFFLFSRHTPTMAHLTTLLEFINTNKFLGVLLAKKYKKKWYVALLDCRYDTPMLNVYDNIGWDGSYKDASFKIPARGHCLRKLFQHWTGRPSFGGSFYQTVQVSPWRPDSAHDCMGIGTCYRLCNHNNHTWTALGDLQFYRIGGQRIVTSANHVVDSWDDFTISKFIELSANHVPVRRLCKAIWNELGSHEVELLFKTKSAFEVPLYQQYLQQWKAFLQSPDFVECPVSFFNISKTQCLEDLVTEIHKLQNCTEPQGVVALQAYYGFLALQLGGFIKEEHRQAYDLMSEAELKILDSVFQLFCEFPKLRKHSNAQIVIQYRDEIREFITSNLEEYQFWSE